VKTSNLTSFGLVTASEGDKCNLVRLSAGNVTHVTENVFMPLSLHAARIFWEGRPTKFAYEPIFKPFKTIYIDRPIVLRITINICNIFLFLLLFDIVPLFFNLLSFKKTPEEGR
jgi:hypothetical protein